MTRWIPLQDPCSGICIPEHGPARAPGRRPAARDGFLCSAQRVVPPGGTVLLRPSWAQHTARGPGPAIPELGDDAAQRAPLECASRPARLSGQAPAGWQ